MKIFETDIKMKKKGLRVKQAIVFSISKSIFNNFGGLISTRIGKLTWQLFERYYLGDHCTIFLGNSLSFNFTTLIFLNTIFFYCYLDVKFYSAQAHQKNIILLASYFNINFIICKKQICLLKVLLFLFYDKVILTVY